MKILQKIVEKRCSPRQLHDFQHYVQLAYDTQNDAWDNVADSQMKCVKWYERLAASGSSNRPGIKEVSDDFLEELLVQVLRRNMPYNFDEPIMAGLMGSRHIHPGIGLVDQDYLVVSTLTFLICTVFLSTGCSQS